MSSDSVYHRMVSRMNGALSAATRFIPLLAVSSFLHYALACPCPEKTYNNALQYNVSEQTPYGHGLLWRIARRGFEPSYLFGTIHLEDHSVTLLPPPVEAALENSNSFISEVVMHPAARAIYAERTRLAKGESLYEWISDPIYTRLVDIAQQEYDIPERVLQGLKPWAVFTLISRPKPVTGDIQDRVLEQLARARRIPVYGLETVDEFVAALDAMPVERQVAILEDTVRNHDRLAEMSARLVDLYMRRDLAGMVALNSRPHDDAALHAALMDRILYRRNVRMAERLQASLIQGRAFIAVGALHLPGKQGLLSLLEARGYRAVAVY